MLTTEIKNIVQNLWDRLWAGGLTNPITSIEQISYLIFLKRLETFKSKLNNNYKWSYYIKKYQGEELVKHIKEVVFPYIKNDLALQDEPFARAMEDSSFRIPSTLIDDAVNYVEAIYIEIEKQEKEENQHFQDIQGDVYEHLLRHTNEAGKNGQFRTQRHIIQTMAELIDPDLDGKICDLACGSGGFLIGAYQYIITKYSEKKKADVNGLLKGTDAKKLSKIKKGLLETNTFFGFDIDQTMVRIGMMNLMMHGITKPHIANIDSLSSAYEEYEAYTTKKQQPAGKSKNRKTQKINDGTYKYVFANPPFTGKINSTSVSENLDRVYPPKRDKNGNRLKQTVQSELLFLERIVFMLQKGGRAAVIVPEGVLFNAGTPQRQIRKILMHDCDLQGVISLPEGVFLPYTSIKTSIIIFQKRELRSIRPQNIDVWFYGLKNDGYSLDMNRRKLNENPLPELIKQWRLKDSKKQSNKKLSHFSIPFEEIEKNGYELNFSLYQDFVYEPENFRKPNEILEQLLQLETEIFEGLKNLKKEEV